MKPFMFDRQPAAYRADDKTDRAPVDLECTVHLAPVKGRLASRVGG